MGHLPPRKLTGHAVSICLSPESPEMGVQNLPLTMKKLNNPEGQKDIFREHLL